MLVDADGTVVSRLYDPTRAEYASGATLDVGRGGSFPAESPAPRIAVGGPYPVTIR